MGHITDNIFDSIKTNHRRVYIENGFPKYTANRLPWSKYVSLPRELGII